MVPNGKLRTLRIIEQINAIALEKIVFKMSLSQRKRKEAEAQHDLLFKFYGEYALEFKNMCQAGLKLDAYHNFRQFLIGLEFSIDRQKEVIFRLQAEYQQLALEGQSLKQKKERYHKIIVRKEHQLRIELDRREQKLADSYAQLRYGHHQVDFSRSTDLDLRH